MLTVRVTVDPRDSETLKAGLCAQELYKILPPDEQALFRDQQLQFKADTNLVRCPPTLRRMPLKPGTENSAAGKHPSCLARVFQSAS